MSAPYVQFYTSDFLAGTSGMTAATKGVYITLLCLMYETEAPLPQSWEILARRCGCTLPAFKKAVSILQDDQKLHVSNAGIWSRTCDKHIASRRERRNSATSSANQRWEKTKQKQGKADANAMRSECYPEPEPDITKREAKASPKRGRRLPLDWVLPKAWGQWAVDQGLPDTEVRWQADQFKDYWHALSGQRAVKLDWEATWRNWIRKALRDRPRRQPKETEADRMQRLARELENERNERANRLGYGTGPGDVVPLLSARRAD